MIGADGPHPRWPEGHFSYIQFFVPDMIAFEPKSDRNTPTASKMAIIRPGWKEICRISAKIKN